MQKYWPKRLTAQAAADLPAPDAEPVDAGDGQDDYDRARAERLRAAATKGWKVELDQYLADPSANVTKESDTVKWWAVCAAALFNIDMSCADQF